MSELKVNKVTPRSGTTVTLGDSGDSVAIPAGVGFNGFNHRNIVINGDMSIAQRSTSVASITATGYYTVDRWSTLYTSLGTWTQSQSTDVPTGEGFATSLKMDCTTANGSPAAEDRLIIIQRFEGQNLQYLKKGNANAVSLTASFWVKSTKTGTFIVELFDSDNTRAISKSYTVDVTDTWEKKTITFEGDTTGTLDNNNGNSFSLILWLGAGTDYTSGTLQTTWGSTVTANRAVGQVNIADSDTNDFYLTGVQLEAGTTASDFEFLPVDVNLARCQRYYQKSYPQGTAPGSSFGINDGLQFSFGALTSDILGTCLNLPVVLRAAPSGAIYDCAGNSARVTTLQLGATSTNDIPLNNSSATDSKLIVRIYGYSACGFTFNYFLSAEL
jgi:hypothetical protein